MTVAAGTDHLYEFAGWLTTRTGVVANKSLFVDAIPDETTGSAVFVLELRGAMPHLLQSTSFIRKPRFRLDIRSTAPVAGDYPDITNVRNLAQATFQACLDLCNQQLLASTGATPGNWLFLNPESEPYLAGRDDHNRVVFSFDANGERQGP